MTIADRAKGTAFEILYAPREVNIVNKRAKVNPDQSYKAKVLRAMNTTSPDFNTPIATQADSLRNQAIKGKV